jgi:hypothetical protein
VGEALLTGEPKIPDVSGRFLQAVAHLTEWVKLIVTIGSALMVLGAALLKDLVKGVSPPLSYVIAVLLILSYSSMLVSLWKCLAFIRKVASSILTTADTLGAGDELQALKKLLDQAQAAFLVAFVFFALLASASLLAWALGWTLPAPPAALHPFLD